MDKGFFNYLNKNLILGFQRAWNWMGGWGKIIDIIIAFATGIILGQGDIFKLIGITVVVALSIYGLISLFFGMFIVPFQESVNQEREKESQKKTIHRLLKRLEPERIKTTKVAIVPGEEVPHAYEDGYYYAYLGIANGENYDLVDCYANLTTLKVKIEGTEEWGDYSDWVKKNTDRLTFPNFDSRSEVIVRRKNTTPERINIAKWKEGKYPTFIFADGTEDYLPEKLFYIEVGFNGEKSENGKLTPIDEIVFHGFLTLRQGTYTLEGGVEKTTQNDITVEEKEPNEEHNYYRFYIKPGEL